MLKKIVLAGGCFWGMEELPAAKWKIQLTKITRAMPKRLK